MVYVVVQCGVDEEVSSVKNKMMLLKIRRPEGRSSAGTAAAGFLLLQTAATSDSY
jgi:hypothetical protein